jgi:hypothetical protein
MNIANQIRSMGDPTPRKFIEFGCTGFPKKIDIPDHHVILSAGLAVLGLYRMRASPGTSHAVRRLAKYPHEPVEPLAHQQTRHLMAARIDVLRLAR